MKEGTVLSPHTAPALSDDEYYLFGGYRIRGSHSGRDETTIVR